MKKDVANALETRDRETHTHPQNTDIIAKLQNNCPSQIAFKIRDNSSSAFLWNR